MNNLRSKITIVLFGLIVFLSLSKNIYAVTYPVRVSVSNGTGKQIPAEMWGVNLQGYLSQPHMSTTANFLNYLTATGTTLTQNMGIKLIRFPGGAAANAYNWGGGINNAYLDLGSSQIPFMKISDGLLLSSVMGAQMLYVANLNSPLNQPPNCQELANVVSFTPDHYDTAANRSLIRFIEFGYDQWLSGNPSLYQQMANACAHVIKNIDPTIQIGLVGYGSLDESPNSATQRTAWNNMLATILPDPTCGPTNTVKCYDFVTDHIYPRVLHTSYVPPFLGQTTFYSTANMSATNPVPINPAAPLNPLTMGQNISPGIPVAFTEWNLGCENNITRGTPVAAAGTVEQGMFTALTIFDMVDGGAKLSAYHDFTIDGTMSSESGCGILTRQPDGVLKLSAAGQAIALTSIAAGGTLMSAGVGTHNDLLTIPPNTGCTARDCLDVGSAGLTNVSYLKAYAVRQGNDMYVFLINRDGIPANNFDVTLNYNPFTNFTPNVNITGQYLTPLADFRDPVFYAQTVTFCNPVPCNPGEVVLPLPSSSIVRVRIENFFVNAPLPTPTPIVPAGNNVTEIIRMLNSKRPPVKQCVPEVLPYVFACVIYIMVTWLAIEISEWWKQVTLIMCFVIGGVVGYFLCNMTAGFVFGMIMSLFLW